MQIGKSRLLKFVYNPSSLIPLLWPLPLFVLGQALTLGTHFAFRVWEHGSFQYASIRDLPKSGMEGSILGYALPMVFYGTVALAAVILLTSCFSIRWWWLRLIYVAASGTLAFFVFFIMHLAYICDTGIDCM